MPRSATVALALVLAAGSQTARGDEPSAPLEGDVVAFGSFQGASGHDTSGTVWVVRLADGSHAVELGPDFSLDGAPDPVVGFGADGYVPASQLGPLPSLTGRQVFPVPAELDVARFDQVWVWCEQFAVPLGVAVLVPS